MLGEIKIYRWRTSYGMFDNLILKLRSDREHFSMSPDRFNYLLTLVGDKIQKQTIQLRVTISRAEHLSLTLRCLISENS